MKKFLLKIALYTLVILILGNGVALMSLYFLGQSNLYKPQFIKNGVVEKKFDYVVLGSSTGLTTLDTKQIDSTLQISGLNISMDDSALSSHYLMLQYFYAQQKTTKCLVLAVTPWDLKNVNPVIGNNDYRFLSERSTNVVEEYYANINYKSFPVLKLSNFIPLVGVSYYNTEIFYPSLFSALQPQKRNRFDDRGNYSYPTSGQISSTEETTNTVKIQNPYFEKIITFCKQHEIEVVIYQSPLYNKNVEFDYKGLIINHSNYIKQDNLFYDNLHVNNLGRKLCSADFALQFLPVLKDME